MYMCVLCMGQGRCYLPTHLCMKLAGKQKHADMKAADKQKPPHFFQMLSSLWPLFTDTEQHPFERVLD